MPMVPVAPKRLLFSLAALPVGLILGLAFALMADYLNDRVRTERDLCQIRGLNYLGKFDARHS